MIIKLEASLIIFWFLKVWLHQLLKCDISFGYKTDHSLIFLSLLKSVIKRGPGFWKLNTSLLANSEDVEIIRNKINAVLLLNTRTPK